MDLTSFSPPGLPGSLSDANAAEAGSTLLASERPANPLAASVESGPLASPLDTASLALFPQTAASEAVPAQAPLPEEFFADLAEGASGDGLGDVLFGNVLANWDGSVL